MAQRSPNFIKFEKRKAKVFSALKKYKFLFVVTNSLKH